MNITLIYKVLKGDEPESVLSEDEKEYLHQARFWKSIIDECDFSNTVNRVYAK